MHARNILINTPLFCSLGNEELCAFEQYFKEKKIDKNTVIFQEQEQADAFFLIIEGKVKVMLTDREGREVIVAILGSGEYFGEMALLDTAGRSAQVMAMQPCRVLALAKDDFYRCLNGHPDIAMKIIQLLSQRLRRANDTINSLATLDVQACRARSAGGSRISKRPVDGRGATDPKGHRQHGRCQPRAGKPHIEKSGRERLFAHQWTSNNYHRGSQRYYLKLKPSKVINVTAMQEWICKDHPL